MPSKEVLLQKIADARAKENISWICVIAGVIILIVGLVPFLRPESSFWGEQTSLTIVVIGFLFVVIARGSAAYFSGEKSKYLRKLEKITVSKNVCPKCGKEIPQGNFAFCPFCGAELKT